MSKVSERIIPNIIDTKDYIYIVQKCVDDGIDRDYHYICASIDSYVVRDYVRRKNKQLERLKALREYADKALEGSPTLKEVDVIYASKLVDRLRYIRDIESFSPTKLRWIEHKVDVRSMKQEVYCTNSMCEGECGNCEHLAIRNKEQKPIDRIALLEELVKCLEYKPVMISDGVRNLERIDAIKSLLNL